MVAKEKKRKKKSLVFLFSPSSTRPKEHSQSRLPESSTYHHQTAGEPAENPPVTGPRTVPPNQVSPPQATRPRLSATCPPPRRPALPSPSAERAPPFFSPPSLRQPLIALRKTPHTGTLLSLSLSLSPSFLSLLLVRELFR
ncbi:hypothetical protein BT93_J1790 [Corymbia citriodora subsp. variegata]|nr:hypothetical protein BT93_J1790 [Corymbia citriodora subsp. variegata]